MEGTRGAGEGEEKQGTCRGGTGGGFFSWAGKRSFNSALCWDSGALSPAPLNPRLPGLSPESRCLSLQTASSSPAPTSPSVTRRAAAAPAGPPCAAATATTATGPCGAPGTAAGAPPRPCPACWPPPWPGHCCWAGSEPPGGSGCSLLRPWDAGVLAVGAVPITASPINAALENRARSLSLAGKPKPRENAPNPRGLASGASPQGFAGQSTGSQRRLAPSPLVQQRRSGAAFCSLRLGCGGRFLWL